MVFSRRVSYGAVKDPVQSSSGALSGLEHDGHKRCVAQDTDVGQGQGRHWIGCSLVGILMVGAFVATIAIFAGSRTLEYGTQREASFTRNMDVAHEGVELLVGGSASMAPLEFSALNFYQVRDGLPGQAYPWLENRKLIEPHRETILTVTNPHEGLDYQWTLRVDRTNEVQASGSGIEFAVILTWLQEHVVTLEEVNSAGVVLRHLDETVMVKYVRREIRMLTDVERGELLDSMHQLWVVPLDDGKEMYGDDYLDIWTINKLHHLSGSGYTCDHFHSGVGFLTNHILITNIFERSLQLVDPKLSLPYWDFTIESSSSSETKYDPDQPTSRTPLLDPSWFGTFDRNDNMSPGRRFHDTSSACSEDERLNLNTCDIRAGHLVPACYKLRKVKDGRWAYTEVPRVEKDNMYEMLRSDVYGKLRSPWNVNDRPYMTRGAGNMCGGHIEEADPWPTCNVHYNLVTNYDEFYSWSWASMGGAHGPIHFWLGGFLDCEQPYDRMTDLVGSTMARAFRKKAFDHRKGLYWDGIWYCEGSVNADISPEELLSSGVCGCQGFDLTQGDDYKNISTVLDLSDLASDFDRLDEDIQREVVRIVCTAVIALGEQTQSSSSLDPMFWSIHPNMERLWQFSVLTGRVADFTWPDDDITYHGPDHTPVEKSLSVYSDRCEGHRGSDVFPFGILLSDREGLDVQTDFHAKDAAGSKLTNREVLAALNPGLDNARYIYDDFKWDHCEVDGYNFDALWSK